MLLIILYSILLMGGIVVSQTLDVASVYARLTALTTLCLAYIMVEVGLEFTIQKTQLKQYVWDFSVASTAAILPWLLCAFYFMAVFGLNWKESALVGIFAAPTSAGVLFAMLTAAGLGLSWVFKKARLLAIFDDIVTILLLIPLQIMLTGLRFELLAVIAILILMLIAAYQWLNCLRIPTGKLWLFAYSLMLVIALTIFSGTTHIHLEILLPAFVLGCIIYNPHQNIDEKTIHELTHAEAPFGWEHWFDRAVKGAFMFLVGCSLPKIDLGLLAPMATLGHVIILTVISNIGKCFILFCYRTEATLRSRLALSVAMFPRGEVGAGVLLIAMSHGLGGIATSLSVLSLALNLLLTGVFIAIVLKLIDVKAQS